jgi:N-carbamoylputrescine amidase
MALNSSSKRTIGLLQSSCVSDRNENLEKAIQLTHQAADRGAQIICTQELFTSQYFCQSEDPKYFNLAESIPGPTTEIFQKIAKERKVVLILSLFEKRAPGLYHNTAAIIDADGTFMGVYRKNHIPDDPLFMEKYYFTPGDRGFRVWDTLYGKIGVLICWDQWYPEAARLTAMQGAEILFYPTAIGWIPEEKPLRGDIQRDAWRSIQRSHAIANGLYVAAINRTGWEQTTPEGGLEFWGGSFVAGPMGEILAEASETQEEVLITEVDFGTLDTIRTEWPFFRDRRIDLFGGLTERYGNP